MMRANRWWPLALGVGAYLAFLLVSFPASTALRWFVPGEVKVSGVQGTLWSGRAAALSVGQIPLQDLRWRASPWPLFTGRLSADVEARLADGFLSAHVSASPSRVRLSDARFAASLPTLQTLFPLGGTRGQATANLSMLELAGGWPTTVVGELRLAKLEVPPFVRNGAAQLIPLGDYLVRFELPAGKQGVAATFNDTGGPLEVSGTLGLQPTRVYAIEAFITPRAEASPDLVQGLSIMTQDPDSSGRRRFMLSGSL
ncbi:MAG TPA: type II secretion system protein N [Gammaproteobacteria bacterium]|nr:type II secretion system protein N [Gammaproteobacteria bacterium]